MCGGVFHGLPVQGCCCCEHESNGVLGRQIGQHLVQSVLETISGLIEPHATQFRSNRLRLCFTASRETSHLPPGQITWTTVAKAIGSSYGKTALVPVVRNVLASDEVTQRKNGTRLRDLTNDRVGHVAFKPRNKVAASPMLSWRYCFAPRYQPLPPTFANIKTNTTPFCPEGAPFMISARPLCSVFLSTKASGQLKEIFHRFYYVPQREYLDCQDSTIGLLGHSVGNDH